MKDLIKILLLIISSLVLSRKQHLLDLPEESYQLTSIDDANYNKYLSNEHFFILIHNPWCPWSQKFEKHLTKINLYLKLEKQPFFIGQIDNSVTNFEFLPDFPYSSTDINYPSLFYFHYGKFKEEFKDRRTLNETFNWIKKQIYTDPIDLSTTDLFDYKLKVTKRAFVYYPSKEEIEILKSKTEESLDDDIETPTELKSSHLFNIYKSASQSKYCDKIVFYYSTNIDLFKKFNSETSKVAFFKLGNNTDNLQIENETEFTKELIEDFCYKVAYRNMFHDFNEHAIEKIFIQKNPALVLFRNKFDNRTEYEEIKLETISWMNRDINIVITDIDNKNSLKLSKMLGVKAIDLPAIRMIDFKGNESNMRTFVFTKEMTSDNILDFVSKWEENKLSESNFIQPIKQRENKQSSVMNISLTLFYEKVIMNRKNVLVFYYSDWCSHCKKHLSLFEHISKKLNLILVSLVQIDIGQFYDSTTKIEKVPSIVLYKSNLKEKPIEFKGKISMKNLIAFIRNNLQGVFKQEDL